MLQSYVIYLKYQTNNMIFSSEFWMDKVPWEEIIGLTSGKVLHLEEVPHG